MVDSNLVPKRNAKSAVWAYFRFIPDANGEPKDLTQPICTICKKCVPVKDKQTTNLFGHIRVHHPSEAAKLPPTSAARIRCCGRIKHKCISAAHNIGSFCKINQIQARQRKMGPVYNSCCKISGEGVSPISDS